MALLSYRMRTVDGWQGRLWQEHRTQAENRLATVLESRTLLRLQGRSVAKTLVQAVMRGRRRGTGPTSKISDWTFHVSFQLEAEMCEAPCVRNNAN